MNKLERKIRQVIELQKRVAILESQLRDATDLLNDCNYQLIDGVWRDMEYYPDDMEE
tara:strand:- start:2524 stop:2694 length:171 start_codon:yes stop_codon:yes gene_type:complete